jgi:hypothetical protein
VTVSTRQFTQAAAVHPIPGAFEYYAYQVGSGRTVECPAYTRGMLDLWLWGPSAWTPRTELHSRGWRPV